MKAVKSCFKFVWLLNLKHIKGLLVVLLALFLAPAVYGQTAPDVTDAADRSHLSLFPILGYSPETSGLLGAGASYSFRVGNVIIEESTGREARLSSMSIFAVYTLKNQFVLQAAPSLYLDGETWSIDSGFGAVRFPNTFFPVGNDTRDDENEDYDTIVFGAETVITRRVVHSLRLGAQGKLGHAKITDKEPGGDLDTDAVTGSNGGVLLGVGPVLVWDNRDNNNATRSGGRYALSTNFFSKTLGSDFTFQTHALNLRHFLHLGGAHVLAAQFVAESNRGDVPFQNMGELGGPNKMRGFFAGRFRDHDLLTGQVEYRFPLYWRFGGSTFIGSGDVAPRLDELDLAEFKVAGGGGVRYAINPDDRINIRLDVAATNFGDTNFYIAFGEAF